MKTLRDYMNIMDKADRLYWSDLSETLSVDDKIRVFENYFTQTLYESNDDHSKQLFADLVSGSDRPEEDKKYITVPLILVNGNVSTLDSPAHLRFVKHGDDNTVICARPDNSLVRYPDHRISSISHSQTLFFSTVDQYDQFRNHARLGFDLELPEIALDEGSMADAAHNPTGPKFGGYYGATQKGPPRPGQGAGGCEESEDFSDIPVIEGEEEWASRAIDDSLEEDAADDVIALANEIKRD